MRVILDAPMIRAMRSRILVKLLPVYDGESSKMDLIIVDRKKHYDHASRRGIVESVGVGVDGISVGDVVVFRGDAGYSMDGDPEMRTQFGENDFRWLKGSDCFAIEETMPKKVLQEA